MHRGKFTEEKLRDIFTKARSVFAFTGAGASQESGLPTFREIDGEWKRYDPMTFATMAGFVHDPLLVWNMYRSRQKQISQAEPNPGHVVFARMEDYYPDFLLATQNVDDLHERAGSRKMVKLHGDAWQMRCLHCEAIHDVRDFDLPDEFTADTLPKCPDCGSLCRPNIVWFGEYLDRDILERAIHHAANCDLMLVIGTSGEVSNGYGFVQYARHSGATVIEINPNEGALTPFVDCWIREPSGAALPRIWAGVTCEATSGARKA
jgi:NAD-dependent deacetylase